MLMGVIGWVVLGTIAGFIASKIVSLRGDDPRMGIGLGALGGLIGGWLYSLISGSAVTSIQPEKSRVRRYCCRRRTIGLAWLAMESGCLRSATVRLERCPMDDRAN
jgi:uncharacterized membrane protein YeaQ/YmgE (transglycosylase-associated protein family)